MVFNFVYVIEGFLRYWVRFEVPVVDNTSRDWNIFWTHTRGTKVLGSEGTNSERFKTYLLTRFFYETKNYFITIQSSESDICIKHITNKNERDEKTKLLKICGLMN